MTPSQKTVAIAIGARLRALRVARGMSRAALAEAMGSHPPIVSRIEHGRHAAQIETVRRYCAAIDVPPAAALQVLDVLAPMLRRPAKPQPDRRSPRLRELQSRRVLEGWAKKRGAA